MITEKFKNLFDFAPKSGIKAGDGLDEGNFPFFTSSSVLSKRIDKALYNDEALIFGTGGSASIHCANEPFSTSTDCIVAITKSEELNAKFVYYYLFGNIHILERGFKGAGLKHISKKYIENLDIPVLPFETQNKIVAVLDKASSIVSKRENTIQLLDELLRATFWDMFGDPTRPGRFDLTNLSEYVEKIQIGPFGSQLHQSDYISGAIPLINPVNIIDRKIIPNHDITIKQSKYESLPNYHLKEGDIIMARRGEMGRCGLITKNENGWFCGTGSLFIRPKKLEQSVFLLFCLTNVGTIEFLNNSAKGVTMKNLNKTIITSIPIIKCSLELQSNFAKSYMANENLKSKLKDSLSDILNLFNSIMQKVFNGELNFNIDLELDALIKQIDLQKKENDLSKIITDFAYLQRLIDKLNSQEFNERELYDKAKHAVFQLLKEDVKIVQEYDEDSKGLKLAMK